MKNLLGNLDGNTDHLPSGYATNLVPDQDLEAITGGHISGQLEARRLLDEYLASLDILSRRTDLSDDAKAMMKSSMSAALSKNISDAVSLTPTP
jgi:hypothetical protein